MTAAGGPPASAVKQLFSDIAPRYDLLNTLLSFGRDAAWRRAGAALLALQPGERALDLAAGSGALSQALRAAQPGVRLIAADFCMPILNRIPKNLAHRVAADGLRLPFDDGSFDAASIAFGLRNFEDLDRGLSELARVLKPGGRLLVLEFFHPSGFVLAPMYRLYLRTWLPLLGGLVSGSFSAYRHLSDTIHAFQTRDEFDARLRGAGFEPRLRLELTFGAATAVIAIKLS